MTMEIVISTLSDKSRIVKQIFDYFVEPHTSDIGLPHTPLHPIFSIATTQPTKLCLPQQNKNTWHHGKIHVGLDLMGDKSSERPPNDTVPPWPVGTLVEARANVRCYC